MKNTNTLTVEMIGQIEGYTHTFNNVDYLSQDEKFLNIVYFCDRTNHKQFTSLFVTSIKSFKIS